MKTLIRRLSRILPLLAVIGLATPLAGCGDEPQKEKPQRKASTKKAAKKSTNAEEEERTFKAKKEWDAIRPYFLGTNGYVERLERKINSAAVAYQYKDAFASNVEKYFPTETEVVKGKVVSTKTKLLTGKAKGAATEKTDEEKTIESILAGILPPDAKKKGKGAVLDGPPATPLTAEPLDKYTFTMILTGVASPTAVVDTPDGQSLEVKRNDKIGSEGGYVEDILKQKILIRLPDNPKLVEISLSPGMLSESLLRNMP